MSDESSFGGFVPVSPAQLAGLATVVDEAEAVRIQLEKAVSKLNELADDFRIDAVRRLCERGATEAQVDRYETAYREQAEAVLRSQRTFALAFNRIEAAVQELADE